MWPNRDEKAQIETVYGCTCMFIWASACWDHIFTIFNTVFYADMFMKPPSDRIKMSL